MEQVTFPTYFNLGFSSYRPFVYYRDDIIAFMEEYLFRGAGNEIFVRQADREKEITVEHLADIDRCRDFCCC